MANEEREGKINIEKPLSEVEQWLTGDDAFAEEAYKEKALHLCYEAGLDINNSSLVLRLLLTPYTTVDYDTLIANIKGYEACDYTRLHNLAKSSNHQLQNFLREGDPINHEEGTGYSYVGPDVLDLFPDSLPVRDTYFDDESGLEEEHDLMEYVPGTRTNNIIYTNQANPHQVITEEEFIALLENAGISEESIKLVTHLKNGINSSKELHGLIYGQSAGPTALSRRIVTIRKSLQKHNAPITITSNHNHGYIYNGPRVR